MTTIVTYLNQLSDLRKRFFMLRCYLNGRQREILVYLRPGVNACLLNPSQPVVFRGIVHEETGTDVVTLTETDLSTLPVEEDWVHFFISYFLRHKVETIIVTHNHNGWHIRPCLPDHYLEARINHNAVLLTGLEFSRYVHQAGKKSLNWIRGVFSNEADTVLRFTQQSPNDEDGEDCHAAFNKSMADRVTGFLEIPFYTGWTETEYRLGSNVCYKTEAKASLRGLITKKSITLLNASEQDIPLLMYPFFQWLRRIWADSFFNNRRRTVTQIEVPAILSGD